MAAIPRRLRSPPFARMTEVITCSAGRGARNPAPILDFMDPALAPPPPSPQERTRLAVGVLAPLNIAAYVTWLALSLPLFVDLARTPVPLTALHWGGLAAIVGWLALFVASSRTPVGQPEPRWSRIGLVGQGLLAIAALAAFPRNYALPVLLVIVAAELAMCMSPRSMLGWLVLFNALLLAMLWRNLGAGDAVQSFVSFGGFQAFAVLTGHYAKSAFEARDRLAEVNAHLLSTRELLEESTRSHERLKLSRELHDVAGHKLTALKLNLARILRAPDADHREDLTALARLADELLGDIRAVVSELRRHDGIDLGVALETLSRYVDSPRVHVVVAPDAKVDDLPSAPLRGQLLGGRHPELVALGLRRAADAPGDAPRSRAGRTASRAPSR